VGRADRKAYAYLLIPVHGHLLDVSRRRLQAIMEHGKLGSGFKLAMMDLEIRGAGNLLGTEQSGHIAAIGFDLYCQLLRRAIEYVKSGGRMEKSRLMAEKTVDVEVNLDFINLAAGSDDPGASAYLPVSYIEDEQTRGNIYRKIASAVTGDEIEALRSEFRDRFGPLPEPFERLLKIAAIRIKAAGENISTVETKEGKIMFSRHGEYLQVRNQFPRLRSTDADGKLEEIVRWLRRIDKEIQLSAGMKRGTAK
jgi:transcription-repair coupling factor (superfamily II helicase)